MSVTDIAPSAPIDVTDHPLVHDVNAEHTESLSPVERICKRIADSTGAPLALAMAIVFQFVWIIIGMATKWDPFPFVFLLTISNVVQLILIFILAVGQRQSSAHAELRAEHDHDSISRLLYHQELQENLLLQIATKIECDVSDLRATVAKLAAADGVR
ncbi:MAG: rane protein-like protein [Candidatus Eremiobacteraeota bacterium]|nr:rane protein-like protein [Candidatus Eremiobacteraeota bacterium]